MVAIDPFADAPEDAEAQEEVVRVAPKKVTATKKGNTITVSNNNDQGKLSITLKGGAGFDAPWVVLYPADLQEAVDLVSGENAALLADLLSKVQKAGEHFVSLAPAKAAKAAPAPANAPSRPAGVGEDWTYKEGIGKNGKGWKAWMPPRGSDASPVWL
jgi:hypothetical protein